MITDTQAHISLSNINFNYFMKQLSYYNNKPSMLYLSPNITNLDSVTMEILYSLLLTYYV